MNERVNRCEKHGDFQETVICGAFTLRGCPECRAELAAKRDAEDAREAAETERRRLQSRIAASSIPPRFLSCSLDTFETRTPEQQDAKLFARCYAEAFGEVLEAGRCAIFVGAPGTGKTHLACAIALKVIEAGYSAKYATTMRVLRSVRDTWRPNAERSTNEVLAELVNPDLLILDEVGVQSGKEWDCQLIFDIINSRYERVLPTILASNFGHDRVREFIGDRAFDRLREGGGQSIPFTWESHRGNSRKGKD